MGWLLWFAWLLLPPLAMGFGANWYHGFPMFEFNGGVLVLCLIWSYGWSVIGLAFAGPGR